MIKSIRQICSWKKDGLKLFFFRGYGPLWSCFQVLNQGKNKCTCSIALLQGNCTSNQLSVFYALSQLPTLFWNVISILKQIVWETQKWLENFTWPSDSWVVDQNNILHALIDDSRTVWPTVTLMLFWSFSVNLLQYAYILHFKWVLVILR